MMPAAPDFDRIARRFVDGEGSAFAADELAHKIAEQLRLAWNARGAADLASAIEASVTYIRGGTDVELIENLGRALRALDR